MRMAKKVKNEIFDFAKETVMNKKFQIGLTLILFLIILISSTSLRLSNLPVLIDQTTGLYTSNDLDSLYFYRIAETKLLNGGTLPEIDVLRSPGQNVTWLKETLPDVMIFLYKIEKIFVPNISFNYSATISAPIIFAIMLIVFFFLCMLLTKSKTVSLISSALLAFSPAFLFRSIAGFYDHDHLGVLAIIISIVILFLSLQRFEKNWKETFAWGIGLGLSTALVLTSWGGAITFVFVCFPVALFLYYLLNNKKRDNFLAFYALWILFSVIFTPIFGGSAQSMYSRFLDSQGLAVLFVFGFALIDYLLGKFKNKLSIINEKNEKAYTFALTIILGLIGLLALGKNPLSMFKTAWATLIYPFFREFGGRLGTTVAENSQPYLVDFISQMGNFVFWFFLLGLIIIGILLSKNVKDFKNKFYLSGSAIILFLAILCSRVSSSYFLNGENLLSQAVYLFGALIFFAGFVYVYSKEKFQISNEVLLLFALALTVVINARSATRSFFLIAPFVCLIAGYFILQLFNYSKNVKDETFKYVLYVISILSVLLILFALFGNPLSSTPTGLYEVTSSQAKYLGSSVNTQWQNAMAWARNNTSQNDIFIHWWDYGYFVQTLANRPTVTDGGHSGGDNTDHNTGRYLLTTSNPKTALSYMKTWNVSYLLIDPTEMGKYGAYSQIGSNDSWDRVSTGVISAQANAANDKETSTGIARIYQMGSCVDEDINYNGTFLPGIVVSKTQSVSCKSAIGGILLEQKNNNGSITFKQPIGAFIYNNKQVNLPIKNLYVGGKMVVFGSGIDAVAYVIPSVSQTSDGKVSLDPTGGIIYLSPKVFNSLIGKLYILGDYYKEYPTLTVADSEDTEAVKYFKQVWGLKEDFIYFGGLQAPLKIWKVEYSFGTKTYGEFLDQNFAYGGLDSLFK